MLDDSRDSVRQGAGKLAKSLLLLTGRLVEHGEGTNPDHVREAVKELLPLLLKSSVNTRGVLASEARAVSVGGLLRVVKSAGAYLRPYLADIITVVSTG